MSVATTMTCSERKGNAVIVRFSSPVDLSELTIDQFGKEMGDLLGTPDTRNLVLNFGNVRFMSSSALAKLISLRKTMAARSGRLAVCHLSPDIQKVFQLMRLDRLIPVHETEEGAVAEVGSVTCAAS